MTDNIKELTRDELDKAAGGLTEPIGVLKTFDDINNSSIAEELKARLGDYKRAGHSQPSDCVAPLTRHINCLGYQTTDLAVAMFIKKYWAQV